MQRSGLLQSHVEAKANTQQFWVQKRAVVGTGVAASGRQQDGLSHGWPPPMRDQHPRTVGSMGGENLVLLDLIFSK